MLTTDETDDVVRSDRCFVCRQDGQLVLCDFPGCVEVYHQVRPPCHLVAHTMLYCSHVCVCSCVSSELSLLPLLPRWPGLYLYRGWMSGVSPYLKREHGFVPDTIVLAAVRCRNLPVAFTIWICHYNTICSIGIPMLAMMRMTMTMTTTSAGT